MKKRQKLITISDKTLLQALMQKLSNIERSKKSLYVKKSLVRLRGELAASPDSKSISEEINKLGQFLAKNPELRPFYYLEYKTLAEAAVKKFTGAHVILD